MTEDINKILQMLLALEKRIEKLEFDRDYPKIKTDINKKSFDVWLEELNKRAN